MDPAVNDYVETYAGPLDILTNDWLISNHEPQIAKGRSAFLFLSLSFSHTVAFDLYLSLSLSLSLVLEASRRDTRQSTDDLALNRLSRHRRT